MSVAIVGAGIIGLACAEELSRRGAEVTLYDRRQPGAGASWVAAGMLAPAYEAAGHQGQHPDLFELCRRGGDVWPSFARRVELESGLDVGYSAGPSLAVACHPEHEAQLLDIEAALACNRVPFERLDRVQLIQLEPSLSDTVQMGLVLHKDGQVDNRRVIKALLKVFERRSNVQMKIGVDVSDPKSLLSDHDAVICAAGWESVKLGSELAPIRPVGGQLLILEKGETAPIHSLRRGPVYIVPKADRIVVGASVEPGRVSRETDQVVLDELLEAASEVWPGLSAARVRESWAGIRPGTSDHAPIIGRLGEAPIYTATGHYRNGILLAPITAVALADMILNDHTAELIEAFSAKRFASQPV